MLRETFRTARKPRRCRSCEGPIPAGVRYREAVTSPGHDGMDFTDIATGRVVWMTWRRCAGCCERYGTPLPELQPAAGP